MGTIYVQHFDTALANWYGEPHGICVFSPTCGPALVIEHNGDMYSCDHFVDRDHLLGNILKVPLIELVNSNRQRQFGRDKREKLPSPAGNALFSSLAGANARKTGLRTPDEEPA